MQSKGSLMKMFGFGKKAKEEKESSSSNPPGNNSVAAANSNDSNDSQNSVRVMSSADSKDVIPYDLPMKRSSGVLSKQRLSVDGREANLAPTPTGFGLTRESSDCTAFSEVDMGAVLTATTPPPKEKRDSGIFKAMGKWSLDSAEKKRPSVTKEGLTAQHVAAKSTKSNTIRPRIMKFDKLKLPMDVLLKSLLKIRSKDGSWIFVNMETGVSPQGRTLSIRTNSGPYDTIVVDMNSYIFESTLATNGFQLVVYGRILHFSAPSIDVTAAWIYHLRDVIADCGTYPSDPLFKEALLRQPGESYDIKFLEKRTTGVVFERTLEWAYVKSGTDVVEEGSLLSSVNDSSVALLSFEETLGKLRKWMPPLKLTFRKVPRKKGHLLRKSPLTGEWKARYYVLQDGKLFIYKTDEAGEQPEGMGLLIGMSVNLVPESESGREHCFQITFGFDSFVMQAASYNEMMDWACALYYGIAIANGGGYVLALERLAKKAGRTVKVQVARAIAREQVLAMLRDGLITEDEMEALEDEYVAGLVEDKDRVGIEAKDAEDNDERIRKSVMEVMEDMIGVILHANPEPVKPVIEKKKPELIPEPVPQPEPEEYNAPMEDIAQELEPEPEVEEAEPEMQEDISQELEPEPDVEEAEPEMQATLEGDTEAVEENVDHGTTTIEQEPAYQKPDIQVTEADLRKVFKACAKLDDKKVGYINVMQFSSIWRVATGVKGNLYKEMKIFNTKFDTGGKGFVKEDEFVAGFLEVCEGPTGEEIHMNLLKLAEKDASVP